MSPPLRSGFSRLLAARLSLMHALNFLGVGFYLPFFPVWLASKGLSDIDIGYVLAIPILVRVFVASSVTGLGDRLQPNLLLALLNALAATLYFALAPQDQLVPIAMLTALSAIALSGVVPLADVLTTEQVKAGALRDYGRVRLWGSVTFVLSNLAGGYLIAQHGAWLIPFVLAGSSSLAALAALQAPSPPGGIASAVRQGAPPASFKLPFWLAVGAAACVNATHAALYAFGSLHWRSLGFSGEAIGWLWAVGVLAEIAVFLIAGGIAARGLVGLRWIAIAALVAALRFGAMSADLNLSLTFLLQLLHGITFGCAHLGSLAAVSALAPDARRAAAQGRLVAAGALAMGVMTVLSGYLYRLFGPGVFLAMVPVALLGLVLAALAILRARGNTGLGGRI
ncbi:MFS transporter, PPP family, 3-phenylpropionic acid transporter [Bosea sp. CRIB-10]|uniref:MFS transporter n=1 Tax=Bosea sp. CRIB-10 TaxID=378404 RepID=UPI0008EC5241|nr:MFS transporter [Bosea sp. CRIB-10]SFD15936.1 MFS transporter, PPP family, 3-phenylpropionic acid transporter [Bosea sp. CRIB-10]